MEEKNSVIELVKTDDEHFLRITLRNLEDNRKQFGEIVFESTYPSKMKRLEAEGRLFRVAERLPHLDRPPLQSIKGARAFGRRL